LEKYKLPRTFRKSHPELPKRLYPIFRDRDELASAHDLSESIRKAMDDSEALIVICSPAARNSHWVNEEIRRFKASDRGQNIYCFMVAGSPDPKSTDCCFPTALLLDDDGQSLHEPLAADATPQGDGKRNAMLKIAAGLLGVGVDDLKQRDAQRQARFWSFVALGTTFIAATTIGLAIYAFNAKKESEMRRQQAEGLIGFMLGDLRKKLEPIGKLELLDAVGDQAMDYFMTLGNKGTPKEMLARAVALKQIGDVRFNQGELDSALKAFKQSLAQTEALHKTEPANNDYLFELGQAEFWVGYVAWQRGEFDQASQSMQRYLEYSKKLGEREPKNVDYQLEVSYALSNLGALSTAQSQPDNALKFFRDAAIIGEALLRNDPGNTDLAMNLSDTLSWIGSTELELGHLKSARSYFKKSIDIIQPFHLQGEDKRTSDYFARQLAKFGDAEISAGEIASGIKRLEESKLIFEQLQKNDPTNKFTQSALLLTEFILLSASAPGTWPTEKQNELTEALQQSNALLTAEPSDIDVIQVQARLKLLKLIGMSHNEDALTTLSTVKNIWADWESALKGKKMNPDLRLTDAMLEEALGNAYSKAKNIDMAKQHWQSSATKLKTLNSRNLSFIALQRNLSLHLNHENEVEKYDSILNSAGYNDPRMDTAYWALEKTPTAE
jgi:tetratricopeptide (TPR) repeat protein